MQLLNKLTPFRVGRKTKRAVLDCNGQEFCVFHGTDAEQKALELVEVLNLKGGAGDAPLVVHYKEQTKEMLETILKHSSWEQLKYTYEQIGNLMQKIISEKLTEEDKESIRNLLVNCGTCNGRGWYIDADTNKKITCLICEGKGKVEWE